MQGTEDFRTELVGGVFDSLGTQAAQMGAKNVLLSRDHSHSTNKIADFFASLIAGLEAGNTSQALVSATYEQPVCEQPVFNETGVRFQIFL